MHNDYGRQMAKFALDQVQSLRDNLIPKVNTQVKRLPSMIQTNGLAPTIAFFLSKRDKEYEISINAIRMWLKDHFLFKVNSDDGIELMNRICELETPKYRLVTNEAIQLFDWMRRFTNALAEGEESEQG